MAIASTPTYEEMAMMSMHGAKVLEEKAARQILKHKLSLSILSSFIEGKGTQIIDDIKNRIVLQL